MNNLATQPQGNKQLIQLMADRYSVDQNQIVTTVKATCFDGKPATDSQFYSFMIVANEYKLNPFTKEIYAFPSKGTIVPIVSIDGWLSIINSHPQFDGMEFKDNHDANGNLISITCKMFRKDREHSIEVTEYLNECKKNSEPWNKWPVRMLRHKATIQCARYAFGFSGISDPDEAERIDEANVVDGDFSVCVSGETIKSLTKAFSSTNTDIPELLKQYNVEAISDLTEDQAKTILQAKRAEYSALKAETQEVEMDIEL